MISERNWGNYRGKYYILVEKSSTTQWVGDSSLVHLISGFVNYLYMVSNYSPILLTWNHSELKLLFS